MKRIGIAFSDETKFLASPFKTYVRKGEKQDLDYLADLIQTNKVDEIVCGLPLNMSGEEQDIAIKTRNFVDQLSAQTGTKVVYQDERLSSVMAEDYLKETERDWRKRKERLDSVAASIILQSYLDSKGKNRNA